MLEVGSRVLAKGRYGYPVGVVKELINNSKAAIVHFKMPLEPKRRNVCDNCGFPGMLSVNGVTFEVVCMRTGCGWEHGFSEVDEVISVDQLLDTSEKERAEERTRFNARTAAVLREGVSKGFITIQEMEQMLKAGRCLPS